MVRIIGKEESRFAKFLGRLDEIGKLLAGGFLAMNKSAVVGVESPGRFLVPIPGLGHHHFLVIEAEDGNHRTTPYAPAKTASAR